MDKITNHPILNNISNFITTRPVLWFCLFCIFLLFTAFNWLAKSIPQFDIFKSKILLPLARKRKHKRLAKIAIKSDIRGHINLELNKINKYLPKGWAEEMDIDWVESEDFKSLIDDKKIVVRIRPLESQDHNFAMLHTNICKQVFFLRIKLLSQNNTLKHLFYLCVEKLQ